MAMPARSVSGAHTSAGTVLEVEREGDGVGLIDGDDHAAVTEPLGDAHAAVGRDLADDRPERAEQAPGGVVAERGRVVREPREVQEDERAGHPHAVQDTASGGACARVHMIDDARYGGHMPARFTYSRWDGTQQGFELDGDALLEELTDELLYHGDVNAALRRMMHQGLRDRNGERLQGVRELLEKLRQERQERLDRFDLGGVYDEIARELDDIVDEERHAIDNAVREAEAHAQRTGDERRAETARESAMDRNMRLDFLPDDLAGKVRELQEYDFESQEASRRFEELLDRLRQQLANQLFEQMSGAMQQMTPEDLARMKDMMAALNEMLERREQGEDPRFEEFMEQYGDFFPENPQTLDELLEQLAQKMAAMQAMLNSMTPEQRAQLQELSDQLLGDMDLRWQMDQLGRPPAPAVPAAGLEPVLRLPGPGPARHGPGDADDAGARRPRPAREPAAQRLQPRRARRGRHGPRPRPARRRRRPLAGATRRADPHADRGRADRAARGPPRADADGAAGDRLQRPARPVLQADQGPGRPAPGAPPRPRPRADVRHQALRVRRPVPARPAAHDPQRPRPPRPRRRRHAGASWSRTTSRSSAPST